MILTVTLNPAVDKTYQTGTVVLGQVNRMRSVVNIPGGKGINVSKILRRFQKDVTATGFVGGYNGRFIEDSMRDIGVDCEFVHVKEETRTSINVLAADGFVTELLEPGPMILPEQMNELVEIFPGLVNKSDLVVLSGSAAIGLPEDIYATLITECNNAGIPVILDTSGPFLMEGVKALPTMIKPNQRELEFIAGHRLKDISEIEAAARIINNMGVSQVVVTMGARGIVYVDDEVSYYVSAPHVETVSTVGCGDCVTAACAIAMTEHKEVKDMMTFASAVGAANAMTLENGNIDPDVVQKLMGEVGMRAL